MFSAAFLSVSLLMSPSVPSDGAFPGPVVWPEVNGPTTPADPEEPVPVKTPNKKYKNCAALNKVYKHGIGLKGAKDKTTGKPVTTFKVVSKSMYALNKHMDRDKDKIACERK